VATTARPARRLRRRTFSSCAFSAGFWGGLVHQLIDVATVGRHFRTEVGRQATQVDHRLAGQFGQAW
jgi:hypothetical protein